MKNYKMIFICGYSGAGKTTLSNKLAELLPVETRVIRLDWYITQETKERRKDISAAQETKNDKLIQVKENPFNWQDYHKLKEDLIYLQQHSKVDIPSAWNQKTGLKDIDLHVSFKSTEGIIICEGMYLLHPELSNLADVIIYLDIPYEKAFERICNRDSHRSSKEYLDYKNYLQNKYDIPYFNKFLNAADIKIDENDINPKSVAKEIIGKLNLQKHT